MVINIITIIFAEYNDALRKRGDIRDCKRITWTPEKTGKKGRPQKYSNLAIETCLFLRIVCSLPVRLEPWINFIS